MYWKHTVAERSREVIKFVGGQELFSLSTTEGKIKSQGEDVAYKSRALYALCDADLARVWAVCGPTCLQELLLLSVHSVKGKVRVQKQAY
jgi:hypothetical protein